MNIFKQFIKSVYSPKDIALFRFQGIGKTILYVFFLTLLSVLPTIFYLSTTIMTGIDTVKTVIQDQVPSFTIKNGQLASSSKVPITINQNQFTVTLDPTGAVTEKEVQNENNGFALLKNEFVLASGGEIQTYPYSMLGDVHITSSDLIKLINNLKGMEGIIIPLISLFIYLMSCTSSFIEVSLVALIGLAIKNLTGRKLHYRQLWRMAAYSETLPTLFFTIMAAIKTPVPNSFIIDWFVVIVVLYLAILEIPQPKKIQK